MYEYLKLILSFLWANRSTIRKHLAWLKEEYLRDEAAEKPTEYLSAVKAAETADASDLALMTAARNIAEAVLANKED